MYVYLENACPFCCTAVAGSAKVWPVNWFTKLVGLLFSQTDCPKSVPNLLY